MARSAPKKCDVVECEQFARSSREAYCGMHRRRAALGQDMLATGRQKNRGLFCAVAGCELDAATKGYCKAHYARISRTGNHGTASIKKDVSGWVTPAGYRMVRLDGRPEFVHRVVLAEKIGRPLMAHETAHHINGDRADNRPKNLEIWSRAQPAGQRVEDKIAFYKAFLEEYGYVVQKEWELQTSICDIINLVGG